MLNTYDTPISDKKSNSRMSRDLESNDAHKGYYYTNIWEDETSISAVVPDSSFLKVIKKDDNYYT